MCVLNTLICHRQNCFEVYVCKSSVYFYNYIYANMKFVEELLNMYLCNEEIVKANEIY